MYIVACFGYFENKLYMYETISNSGQLLKKCKISGQGLEAPCIPHGASNWCRGTSWNPVSIVWPTGPWIRNQRNIQREFKRRIVNICCTVDYSPDKQLRIQNSDLSYSKVAFLSAEHHWQQVDLF